jgi:hypothetical protein
MHRPSSFPQPYCHEHPNSTSDDSDAYLDCKTDWRAGHPQSELDPIAGVRGSWWDSASLAPLLHWLHRQFK